MRITARHMLGLGHRARYVEGLLEGPRYRLVRRRRNPSVSDDILADRIRSSLGQLAHRIDPPWVHVMVFNHGASLYGEVPHVSDAETIERAVHKVPGVRNVESFLHIGMGAGSTRPSIGPDPETRKRLSDETAW